MIYIKNSLKLFLLGLITPLLCGVSFGFDLTQDELTYIDNNSLVKGSFNTSSNYLLGEISVNNGDMKNVCVIFSGFSASNYAIFSIVPYYNSDPGNTYSNTINGVPGPYWLTCTTVQYANRWLWFSKGTASGTYSVNHYWVVDSSVIFDGYLGFDIQGLINSLDTCSNSLNQCDTSVQQCLIDKESLSGSLVSCNIDKNSLQNYNDSLTEQLNQCLNDNLSGDYISGSFLRYSMFWQDNDTMFSLPITNDLFLPNGYKGKLDEDNVLSIAKLNTLEASYQFSDEDKITIIDLLSMVMLFLLATGSLIGIILFLKRLIIKK